MTVVVVLELEGLLPPAATAVAVGLVVPPVEEVDPQAATSARAAPNPRSPASSER
jgi:hypothetical protein